MKYCLLLLLAFSHCLMAQDDEEWLSVALVRYDGIIVPVARNVNGKWEKTYNQPKKLRFYERFVRDWHLTNNIDRSTSVVRNGTPVNFNYENQSSIGWGYLCDFRFDYSKAPIIFQSIVGIATNLAIPQSPVSRLTSSDSTWKKLELAARRAIKDNAIHLSEAIVTQLDSTTLYYIEAGKTISTKPPCPVHFISVQWIVGHRNVFTTIYQDSTTDDCDFKLSSEMHFVPYGGFRFDNSDYFIISSGGWETTDYRLVSISLNGIVDILVEKP